MGRTLTIGMIPLQNNGSIIPSVLVHSSNEGKTHVQVATCPVGAVGTLELFPSKDISFAIFDV
jgi:hypothetical protein